MLWSGLSAAKDKTILNPQVKLHCQIQALSFLLLLDTETAVPTLSKAPIYTEDAITEFENGCETVTKEDASFLLQEMQTLFKTCFSGEQSCKREAFKHETSSFYVFSEMVLLTVKTVCKAGFHSLAFTFLNDVESKMLDWVGPQCTPLVLGKWGVKIHAALKADKETGRALTECARALRSISADLGNRECHAILEGCSLVVWAVENGHSKGVSGLELLAVFSFLEEYQEWILKMPNKVSGDPLNPFKMTTTENSLTQEKFPRPRIQHARQTTADCSSLCVPVFTKVWYLLMKACLHHR